MATYTTKIGGIYPPIETGKQVSRNGFQHYMTYGWTPRLAGADNLKVLLPIPRHETWLLEHIGIKVSFNFDEMTIFRYRWTQENAVVPDVWWHSSRVSELLLADIAILGKEWHAVAAGGDLGAARGAGWGELVSPLLVREDEVEILLKNRAAGVAVGVITALRFSVIRYGSLQSKGEGREPEILGAP